jgi:hypothetical protein
MVWREVHRVFIVGLFNLWQGILWDGLLISNGLSSELIKHGIESKGASLGIQKCLFLLFLWAVWWHSIWSFGVSTQKMLPFYFHLAEWRRSSWAFCVCPGGVAWVPSVIWGQSEVGKEVLVGHQFVIRGSCWLVFWTWHWIGFYLVGWQYLLAPGTAGSSEV